MLLYVLLGYVLVQFSWWAVLLYDLNAEVVSLSFSEGDQPVSEQMLKKLIMIAGEGIVFLSLVLIGAFYIRKFLLRQEKLARQERNFLLATTHELNSPIAAVKLNLQTLKRVGITDGQKSQMIDSGLHTVQRLEGLVTNMLMASRLDSGRMVLSLETLNLVEIINSVLSRFQVLLVESEVKIQIKVKEDLTMQADRQALEIILSNLIHNAIKYAPSTALIIAASNQSSNLILSICDSGPGVRQAELKDIFRKFYRAENEETRSQKGTGLGLYLVSQLVELQKGSITAKSNSPAGLCIQVKLPQKE
jgi:signal transduction histidine kinase